MLSLDTQALASPPNQTGLGGARFHLRSPLSFCRVSDIRFLFVPSRNISRLYVDFCRHLRRQDSSPALLFLRFESPKLSLTSSTPIISPNYVLNNNFFYVVQHIWDNRRISAASAKRSSSGTTLCLAAKRVAYL